MKRNVTLAAFAALASLSLGPAPAQATPWHTMGPRAMGMGGAGVAVAQGPLASYWNPAGLGQLYNASGLAVPVGGHGEFTGSVLQGANDLNQLSKDCQAGAGTCTAANISAAINKLGQAGNGGAGDLGAGLELKLGRAVVFVNDLTYVGGTPKMDTANVGACAGAGCVNQNNSKLVLRGGSFAELGIGYGHELGSSGLVAGVNLKGIVGKVGYYELPIANENAGGGSYGKFSKSPKTSFQPGVDLGLLWDMRETFTSLPMRPRLGLVGRNVNNPRFSQPDAAVAAGDRAKFSEQGQVRAGFALSPLKFWHLAADLDLAKNLTNVDGFKSQILGAGTEINVFNRTWINIPLRVGLQKNLANSGSGVSYTGGFGLNFLHIMVDAGGMVSAKQTTLQQQGKNSKIPSNVAAAAQFAFLFGSYDEGARNK